MKPSTPIRVAHVIYRLDTGGLENGLVNIINGLPAGEFEHVILCLAGYSSEYAKRLKVPVELYDLKKRAGHDLGLFWRLFKLLRRIKPQILHTRNLGTLEAQLPAWLAGVRCRIHGLHGWDVADLNGANARYLRLYRLLDPLIGRYIALSEDLANYLRQRVGVAEAKILRICNGVDTDKFRPLAPGEARLLPPRMQGKALLIGSVGRLEQVKDPLNLLQAFMQLLAQQPQWRERVGLVMVGDGSLRGELEQRINAAGLQDAVWLAGNSSGVAELLRTLDLFVLPSKAEGISNTLLEAMASGVPVVATRVGGNAELVCEGRTGTLVPSQNSQALAEAIQACLQHPAELQRQGQAARQAALEQFSLAAMIDLYRHVYLEILAGTVHEKSLASH